MKTKHPQRQGIFTQGEICKDGLALTSTSQKHSQGNDELIWWFYS